MQCTSSLLEFNSLACIKEKSGLNESELATELQTPFAEIQAKVGSFTADHDDGDFT